MGSGGTRTRSAAPNDAWVEPSIQDYLDQLAAEDALAAQDAGFADYQSLMNAEAANISPDYGYSSDYSAVNDMVGTDITNWSEYSDALTASDWGYDWGSYDTGSWDTGSFDTGNYGPN